MVTFSRLGSAPSGVGLGVETCMKCDLGCPFTTHGIQFCCSNCIESRVEYLKDNPDLFQYWGDNGFWSQAGCRIPRDRMPKECKEYDCRNYKFSVDISWSGNKWDISLTMPKDR